MSAQKSSQSKTASVSKLKPISIDDLPIEKKRKIKSESFALWIRTLLQNWRQGTVKVKGRAEVKKSTKKPWKQKGTGRARAGTARSPLWRGGGVTFGPQPRVRTMRISKKLKKGVLNTLLWDFLENKRIYYLDWEIEGNVPKTRQAYEALKKAELSGKKIALFLSPDDKLTYSSFFNIPNVQIILFDQPNAFNLATNDYWVVLKKDFDFFKEMVSKWI